MIHSTMAGNNNIKNLLNASKTERKHCHKKQKSRAIQKPSARTFELLVLYSHNSTHNSNEEYTTNNNDQKKKTQALCVPPAQR